MRYSLLCLFFLFFVKQGLYGQKTARYLLCTAKETKMQTWTKKNVVKVLFPISNKPDFKPVFTPNSSWFTIEKPLVNLQKHPTRRQLFNSEINTVPTNFFAANLGWVCKQELKLDKKITVPLRFRLGSVDQVNWLEGKTR
jgi:hypothetical protein